MFRGLRDLGPVAAGALLDVADVFTAGTMGLYAGMLVGGTAGFLLAPQLGFQGRQRWLCAAMAGAYCTLPFTAILPLGTLFGLLVRLRGEAERPEAPVAAPPAIDADYRVEPEPGPAPARRRSEFPFDGE